MISRIAMAAATAALLLTTPAVARDRFGADLGYNHSRHYPGAGGRRQNDRSRSGAWIGDNRHHSGRHHHGRWSGGHDHFSPRGQGGYHWGW